MADPAPLSFKTRGGGGGRGAGGCRIQGPGPAAPPVAKGNPDSAYEANGTLMNWVRARLFRLPMVYRWPLSGGISCTCQNTKGGMSTSVTIALSTWSPRWSHQGTFGPQPPASNFSRSHRSVPWPHSQHLYSHMPHWFCAMDCVHHILGIFHIGILKRVVWFQNLACTHYTGPFTSPLLLYGLETSLQI